MENNTAAEALVITPEALLKHWQGHRSLTRRVIDAFSEKDLFEFSIGGMRTFAAMSMELIGIAGEGIKGVATAHWGKPAYLEPGTGPTTKQALLDLWDEVTQTIETYWPQIRPERFQEVDRAFGQYENQIFGSLLYFIDNEIHHRGEGYVYLRALGIEPPYFWER